MQDRCPQDTAPAWSCGSRNETSDRKDKAIHPSGQEDGRIPSPYEASHAHRGRGPDRVHTPYIHTAGFESGSLRLRLRRGVTWPLSRGKKWTSSGCARGRSSNLPIGARAIVSPKMGLTIVQSAGNAAWRTSIARVHACVLACVSRLAEFQACPGVIGLREKEQIAELGNSYVVTDILTVTRSDSIISRSISAVSRLDVVESIRSWPAARGYVRFWSSLEMNR